MEKKKIGLESLYIRIYGEKRKERSTHYWNAFTKFFDKNILEFLLNLPFVSRNCCITVYTIIFFPLPLLTKRIPPLTLPYSALKFELNM